MAINYTVVPGDTPNGIARKFHTTWLELYQHPLNSEYRMIRSCSNEVHPGDVLVIPQMGESQAFKSVQASFQLKHKIDALKQPTDWTCVYTCMVMVHRSYSYRKFITHQPSDIEAMLFPSQKYARIIKGTGGEQDKKIPFQVEPEVKDYVKGEWFNEQLDGTKLQLARMVINRPGSHYGRVGLLEIDKILKRYGMSKSAIDCNGNGFKDILLKSGPFIWGRPMHAIVVFGLENLHEVFVHFIDPEIGQPDMFDLCHFLKVHRPILTKIGGKAEVYHL